MGCSLQYFTMESGGNTCRVFVIEPFGHGESYQKKKSCILRRYVKNVCGQAISMISLMSPISYHLITFLPNSSTNLKTLLFLSLIH